MQPTTDDMREMLEMALDRDLPEFDPDANLYLDLGLDSIGTVALVVEIERRFGARIPDERIPDLRTANDFLRAIAEPEPVT